MDSRPLPPETFFAGTPPHVRVYIEQLHATIADLNSRITELESKQAKNSNNSSLPPSSAHPHAKPARPTPKSLRRSGGQPGHAKHQRPLLPTEQCQRVIPCVPPTWGEKVPPGPPWVSASVLGPPDCTGALFRYPASRSRLDQRAGP
jgi:hypothetical protein